MKTSQLEKKLEEAESFDEELVMSNYMDRLNEYLNEVIEKRGIIRSELIRALNLDRSYGYQLLNGTRTPTRVNLIRIGLFLKMDVDELQKLLKLGGKRALYVKDISDAKVFYAIKHKMEYAMASDFIWDDEKK